MEAINEQQVRRFLLGELPEEQRVNIEERFFKEDAFYKQILAIQEEFADDYVQNNLSPIQRAQFEKHFLQSSIRRERVKFASAFDKAVKTYHQPKINRSRETFWRSFLAPLIPTNNRLALSAVVATLVVFAGTVWLVIENRRLSHEVQLASLDQKSLLDRARNSEIDAEQREQVLEKEIAALRAVGKEMEQEIREKQSELEAYRKARNARVAESRNWIAAFILPPGLKRGSDEPEKLVIPLSARVVQLQLDLESEEAYESYAVEIRTARGNLIWSTSGLRLKRTGYAYAIFLSVPANVLSVGEYEMVLKGATRGRLEAVSYYYFIALRR